MSTTPSSGNESRLVKCDGCGRYFPASEIRRCKSCGQLFCPDCRTTHDCRTSASAYVSHPEPEPQETVQIRRAPETPREPEQQVNYHGGLRFIEDDAASIGSAAIGAAPAAARPYGQMGRDSGEPLIHDNMDSLERSISGEYRQPPAPQAREPYYGEPVSQPYGYQQPPQYPPQPQYGYQQPPQYPPQQPYGYQQPPQYPPQQPYGYQQPPQYPPQQPYAYQQPPMQAPPQQPVLAPDELVCDGCGQTFKKSQLKKCHKCGAILCPACQKKHKCNAKKKQDGEASQEKTGLFGVKKEKAHKQPKEPMSKGKKKLLLILIIFGVLILVLVLCALIITNPAVNEFVSGIMPGLSLEFPAT